MSATLNGTLKPPVTKFGEVTVKTIGEEPAAGLITDGLLIVNVSVVLLTIVPVPTAPVMISAAVTGATGVAAPSVMEKVSFVSSTLVLPTMLTVMSCASLALPTKVSGLAVLTV